MAHTINSHSGGKACLESLFAKLFKLSQSTETTGNDTHACKPAKSLLQDCTKKLNAPRFAQNSKPIDQTCSQGSANHQKPKKASMGFLDWWQRFIKIP